MIFVVNTMNKRNIYIGLGVLVILLLAFWAARYFSAPKSDIITYKEPNLTAEAKAIYEQRLVDYQKNVDAISQDTPEVEKYNRLMNLASTQFSLGFYQKARETYEKALQIRPKDSDAWQIYSSTLAAQKDYQAALDAVKKAISLDSTESDYWKWQIALEKEFFGADQQRLESLYQQALEKTVEDVDIVVVYAQFLEEKGDLAAAIKYWEMAILKNPDNTALYQAEIARLKLKQ